MFMVLKPSTVEAKHTTCPFHQKHPGRQYPGCTCSSSWTSKEKPMSEWSAEEREWYFNALRGEDRYGNPLW